MDSDAENIYSFGIQWDPGLTPDEMVERFGPEAGLVVYFMVVDQVLKLPQNHAATGRALIDLGDDIDHAAVGRALIEKDRRFAQILTADAMGYHDLAEWLRTNPGEPTLRLPTDPPDERR